MTRIQKGSGVKFSISLLFFVTATLGAEGLATVNKVELINKLNAIIQGQRSEFLIEMERVERLFQKYTEREMEKCLNDKPSFDQENTGEKKVNHQRKTKEEAKTCHANLIEFRIRFTQLSFKARKGYLKHTHGLQVDQLADFKEQALKQLRALLLKYK